MKTHLKSRFEIITHANGTHTLRDTIVGQEMHSRVGPWVEAQTIYAEGSGIVDQLANVDSFVLHDVGMGTAANVIATLDVIEKSSIKKGEKRLETCELRIESFEIHLEGIRFALEHLEQFEFLRHYHPLLLQLLEKKHVSWVLSQSQLRVSWTLFECDYFSVIADSNLSNQIQGKNCRTHLAQKPNLIFYDFYSTKAEPDLWTESKFKLLRDFLRDQACELYTYSAATPVRLSLLLAGFFVGQGQRTEMKTETTVAATRLGDLKSPLGLAWIEKLKVSSSVTSDELRARGMSHPQFK